jgi:hypothetical protein
LREGKGKQGSITRLRLQHTGQHRISRDSSSSDRSHGTLQRAATGSVVRELAGGSASGKESSDKHCAVKRRTVSVMGLIGGREGAPWWKQLGELISFWDGIRELLEASFSSIHLMVFDSIDCIEK